MIREKEWNHMVIKESIWCFQLLVMALTWRHSGPVPHIQGIGGTHPEQDCPRGLWCPRQDISDHRAGGLFRFSGSPQADQHSVELPIFSSGILAARRSNHICFQITFTGSFSAGWNCPGLLSSLSGLGLSHPQNLSVSPEQQWIAQQHKCLEMVVSRE